MKDPRGDIRRRFVDAPAAIRCRYDITLRDGTKAQCGRRRARGSDYCKQHGRIIASGGAK